MPGCEVNTRYLQQFSDLIKHRIKTDNQVSAIVTGGGPLARMYQDALRASGETDKRKLDEVGILPTHQNAELLTYLMDARGVNAVYLPSLRAKRPDVPVWVTGGTKPGQSTDGVAVDWARLLGFRQVINITNTPFVYELGTDGLPDRTKPIYELSHASYLTMVGPTHEPGENLPAGRMGIWKAKRNKIDFIVVGPDIDNIDRVFQGKLFTGTRIVS